MEKRLQQIKMRNQFIRKAKENYSRHSSRDSFYEKYSKKNIPVTIERDSLREKPEKLYKKTGGDRLETKQKVTKIIYTIIKVIIYIITGAWILVLILQIPGMLCYLGYILWTWLSNLI